MMEPEQNQNSAALMAEQLKQLHGYYHRQLIELVEAMETRFGPEAVTVVDEVIANRARRLGSLYAKQTGSHSVADYLDLIWEPARADGLEFTAEPRENGMQIHVTRCPVYDLACELNKKEWLYHLVCTQDPYMAEGFNPKMGLWRTKTLMQGQDHCDHFFFMKE